MIKIENLAKSFGNNQVLTNINVEIRQGEVVCLIGPSGSGKSTLLRCINGLEKYNEGLISIDDVPVDTSSPEILKIRQKVSMVFQRFNLFPHRTALENVTEGPIYVKKESPIEAINNAKEILTSVGLGEKFDQYPHQLS